MKNREVKNGTLFQAERRHTKKIDLFQITGAGTIINKETSEHISIVDWPKVGTNYKSFHVT